MRPLFGRGRQGIGKLGERLAAAYLADIGYSLLKANFRNRAGEIDLIAKEGDILVFIEVKTRTSMRFGPGLEAVDSRKQRQLSRVALAYLADQGRLERPARFDVISISLESRDQPTIEHIRNAFEIHQQ